MELTITVKRNRGKRGERLYNIKQGKEVIGVVGYHQKKLYIIPQKPLPVVVSLMEEAFPTLEKVYHF